MAKYQLKNRKIAFFSGLINVGGYLVWGWSRLFRKRLRDLYPVRILVVQLDEFGDVLLSTPAFHYLRQVFPKAHITVMVREAGRMVLAENNDVDEIIMVDIPQFGASIKDYQEDFYKARQAVQRVKDKTSKIFDLGIDLRADIRTIYILKQLGITVRVSQAIRSGGFWLTHTAPYLGVQHEVERKLGIIEFIKSSSENISRQLRFDVTPEDERQADLVLQENGIDKETKLAVLHIFAGWSPKEWPQEKFAEIAKYLHEKFGWAVVIIGTSKEAERINDSKLNREGVFNLAGQTSLPQTAAIIKRAVLFIGNDSGPMHLACVMQTPAVALFGQNTPKRYGPWENTNVTIYHKVECSPCSQTTCTRKPRCMELITVAEVKSAITKLIKAK